MWVRFRAGTTILDLGRLHHARQRPGHQRGDIDLCGLNVTDGGTVNLALFNSPSSGNSLIQVDGALALTGTATLLANKINGTLVAGDYPLFTYTPGDLSYANTAAIAIGPGVVSTRQVGSYIDYTSQPGVVSLDVVGKSGQPGLGGRRDRQRLEPGRHREPGSWWDGTGSNYYANGDTVTFDGTAAGATRTYRFPAHSRRVR